MGKTNRLGGEKKPDASQILKYLSPVNICKHEQELKGVVLGGVTHIT